MSKCSVCSPKACGAVWLYAIRDDSDGCVKVGISRGVTGRLASYRADGITEVRLLHKQVAGCEFTAVDREARALRALERIYPRRRGDWFYAPEDAAVEAVVAACRGYKGARFNV